MSKPDQNQLLQLRESEAKYRRMIELASDGIFAIDSESGKVIDVNPKAEELTGKSRDDLIGLPVWDLHPARERQKAIDLFHNVQKDGKFCCVTLTFERPGRTPVTVEVGASVVTYGGNKFIQRICRDITENRRLERENAELRKFYEFVLNSMPVGLGVRRNVNTNPEISFENRKLREMFATDTAQKHGISWDRIDQCEEACLEQTINEEGIYVQEHSFPDDKTYQFMVSYYRDQFHNWHEIVVAQDVSERHRLRRELENAMEDLEERVEQRTRELKEKQAQLAQSEKMASLGNLVAGVAHEINTPLGALKSNTNMFLRSILKVREFVNSCDIDEKNDLLKRLDAIEDLGKVSETAAERIANIVNTLRRFARLDRAEMDRIDIHEGLDSTLTIVHHEIKNRIEVVRDYRELPLIKCYPNQLNQVFMNILVNASHAIGDSGTITIRTRRVDDSRISIAFEDNGTGIAAEKLNKIFDPGYTTKGSGVGTGLGLSIVHQIIQDHNGTIEVESKIGQGTTFTITLPIDPQTEHERQD